MQQRAWEGWREYVGNFHIHSRYSDGAGSVSEIVRRAKSVGHNFIIINDHEYMTNSLHLEDEGVCGGVHVLMGLEIGRRHHHYLACGLSEMVTGDGLEPQEVIDRVNQQGGFGFLAHPFEKGMPYREESIAYTWNDLSVTGYTGICIWNFSSRWKERVVGPFHGIFFLMFKAWTLKGPSRRTLAFWDRQCLERRVVGIGGSDAHGSELKWGCLRLVPLPYDVTLNSINVHILLYEPLSETFSRAKEQIYRAIKEGCLFIAHDNLKPAAGFRFFHQSELGKRLPMGGEAPFHGGMLFVECPSVGDIRVFKDGILIRQERGATASLPVKEKGVYRVEVHRRVPFFGLRPWIFSNPIYLR